MAVDIAGGAHVDIRGNNIYDNKSGLCIVGIDRQLVERPLTHRCLLLRTDAATRIRTDARFTWWGHASGPAHSLPTTRTDRAHASPAPSSSPPGQRAPSPHTNPANDAPSTSQPSPAESPGNGGRQMFVGCLVWRKTSSTTHPGRIQSPIADRIRPLQEIESLFDDACAAACRPSNRDLISLKGLTDFRALKGDDKWSGLL